MFIKIFENKGLNLFWCTQYAIAKRDGTKEEHTIAFQGISSTLAKMPANLNGLLGVKYGF